MSLHGQFRLRVSRRDWLRISLGAAAGGMVSTSWLRRLAAEEAVNKQHKRRCILLWMSGGPSQMHTFDLKPGTHNGGPFEAIETAAPGVRISEHLPKLAEWTHRMALIRSMSTKEGDHERATFLLRTGYLPSGPVHYPCVGSFLSKELADESSELPNFISIARVRGVSRNAFGPGFLGPSYAPFIVGESGRPDPGGYDAALRVRNMELPPGVTSERSSARLGLLDNFESSFLASRPGVTTESHKNAYDRAVRMMASEANRAFHLEEEKPEVREAYGRNSFGQGCLLARRLIERDVPFVEVTLSGVTGNVAAGWDTHVNNFESVRILSGALDAAWAALMRDLQDRGLLDSTLIVWMGEFGRTPKINDNTGRDHFPSAWSTVLAGGPVKGGSVVGRTSDDGMSVEDRPVSVPDLLSTVCLALGVDPMSQNMSNLGRPIRLVEPEAQPITEILG